MLLLLQIHFILIKKTHRFSTEIASYWGIGKPDTDNGLAIVVCKNLRKVSISTGIGTEKVLTDLICKEVIDSIMIPELKKGNYFLSIREAIFELQKRWE